MRRSWRRESCLEPSAQLSLCVCEARRTAIAEWREFDLDAAEWRIPAEKVNVDEYYLVPLSGKLLQLYVSLSRSLATVDISSLHCVRKNVRSAT